MKETTKVSIGGYAFTLDVDAYQLLQGYLDSLKEHFSTKNEGAEIIQDIEARMSELLQLKNVKGDGVITLADAKDIVKIMGNPKDFGDEVSDDEAKSSEGGDKKTQSSITKKFYRDSDNAILGGVCSGIGHYFNLDPVIVRVIYVVLALGVNPISGKLSAFLFLFYFLLWIIMPAARTFTQRLSMSGEDPSIESIQSGNVRSPKKGEKAGKVLLKVISIVIGVFCYMIGISIILCGIGLLFFSNVTGLPTLTEFLEILGMDRANLDISMIVAWFIPAIILLYIGIRIMIKFTVRDLIVVGCLFAIWLLSSFYIGSAVTRFAREHKRDVSVTETIQTQTGSNTLYVELGQAYRKAESIGDDDSSIFRLNGQNTSWFFIPSVRVEKDSTANDFSIELNKRAFAWSISVARQKAEDAHFDISVNDSLVTINPKLYNKNNPWDRQYYDVVITCPATKEVKVNAFFPKYAGFRHKNININM